MEAKYRLGARNASTYVLAAASWLGAGLADARAEVFFNGNPVSLAGTVGEGGSNQIRNVANVRAFRITELGKCVDRIRVFTLGSRIPSFTLERPRLNDEVPLPPGANVIDISVTIPDIERQRERGCSPNNAALGVGMMLNVVSLAPAR